MPEFVTPMPLVIFRQLKSPGFYPLGGVQGLYLRIRGASECYILRYQDTFGNRRSMSLGLRRSMSLSEARAKATEIRARLSEGINPTPTSASRRQARRQQAAPKPEFWKFQGINSLNCQLMQRLVRYYNLFACGCATSRLQRVLAKHPDLLESEFQALCQVRSGC